MAALLAGSWRASPGRAAADVDLEEIAPLLHRSGAAALAWRRLRDTARSADATVSGLQQAHRAQALAAALLGRHVAHVTRVFRAHGVRPIVFKGWAAARLYPEPGLRPPGDVDLCVRPDEERDARRACAAATEDCAIDLHVGLRPLGDRPWEEIARRCEELPLDGISVSVLGPEDHLRLLALHGLGHGAWRPVWIADIAVALESRPPSFDWEWLTAGSRRRTGWVGVALRLAHALLGARLEGVPAALSDGPTPSWARMEILAAWGDERRRVAQGARLPMRQVRDVRTGLRSLRERWPTPLQATVGVGAAMSSFPRLPIQLAECAARGARFVRSWFGGPPEAAPEAR